MIIYDKEDCEYFDAADFLDAYSLYDFFYNLLAGLLA